ncbi:MAG: DUF4249 family protein [Saprospiraceae bacterium]|nr:DUF4249 family protein [Saprospiraceae bacterium]
MIRYFWIWFVILFSSCIDEIQVNLPEASEQQKVVEGYVERDQNNYIFWGQVSLTQDATGTFHPEPIGANMTVLYDGDIQIPITEGVVMKIPIQEFHDRFGGSTDAPTFRMMAELNGDRYISAEQTIIDVPKADSLSVQVEVRPELTASENIVNNEYVKLLVHSPILNDNDQLVSLSWQVSSTFEFVEGTRSSPTYQVKTCYSTYNVYQNDINIVGIQDYPGKNRISNFEIAETPNDFRFSIGLYFTVIQKSLNQDAIEFWKEVKASNERTGNIYDVFPGRIRTNFTNESNPSEIVNGFFQASDVDTIRLKVNPQMVGYPRQRCELWMEPIIISPDDPDPCLNCLKLANSTLTRPRYWK